MLYGAASICIHFRMRSQRFELIQRGYPFHSFAFIRSSRKFHQSHLFILLLTPPRPLWCLVLSSILQLIALLLRLMHSSRIMFSRRINCNELQRLVSNVDELVLRPSRDYNNIRGIYFLVFSSNSSLALAGSKEQDLIDRVNLHRTID